MNIKKTKKIVIILSIFVLYSFYGNTYGISATSIKLNMKLPKAFHETNFDSDYHVNINKNDYVIKGSPFVFQDYTYIPVGDIAKIFHLNVNYNELDKSVLLSDNEKEIIITPKIHLYNEYGGAMIKSGNETVIKPGVDYILVNDRSYVPLRFITETFGFIVEYENNSKQIIIVGDRSSTIGVNNFSDEQQAIIDAISEYEAKSTVTGKIKGRDFGKQKRRIISNLLQ
ncbi:copper amine oxidase domain protein [Alkaliphilus metalliredigens QYMF]|uniref:Copper amine oxidase domain protein n=1 Tax=Alkaliphilus metalliredigens (strain QYMF) TaxID=293826 RepID=A6TVE6_ALKMQ|nr:copper amine oxidase N-terminal domain-containing protein [Alkaliphilus metalliredigens]ABR50164.1 copper amine oxidase domain protein [Alkaliphilus metalliredigens QYMF]